MKKSIKIIICTLMSICLLTACSSTNETTPFSPSTDNDGNTENYTLDGIENNSNEFNKKQEALITKFVNEVNNNSDNKIIEVRFQNNHQKASIKFDDGTWYTVFDQVDNSLVEYDFVVELEFNDGKATVNNYDDVITAMIAVLSEGYDNNTINNIIKIAKESGTYKDETIYLEYNYTEQAVGYQQADHYRININCFNYH